MELKQLESIKNKITGHAKDGAVHIFTLGKWLVMGLITGTILGVLGAGFAWALTFVNEFRGAHGWTVYLLPIAGLLIVFLYRILKNTHDSGTNMVIESIHSSTQISYKMAPLIVISTILTHLCGGSAGREGAALQLGGGVTNFLSGIKFLRFTENDRRVNVMCGMSAGFAALFGTPMAAAIFSLEVVSVGIMHYSALVPCIIAAFTAKFIAAALGVPAEAFTVLAVPEFTVIRMVQFLIFGGVMGGVSILFCGFMHTAEHQYKKRMPNPYVRIFIAGCMIAVLSMVLGTNRYLGSGIGIIEHIFEENEPAEYYVFLLKMLFTALTLGAGFKGGEIVPSFCVGAAFGSAAAALMGMPVTLVAACGMVGVFCGVTNCPITSLLIAFEMFGFEGMPYYLFTVAVSYMLSGYQSLYHTQRVLFSKIKTDYSQKV